MKQLTSLSSQARFLALLLLLGGILLSCTTRGKQNKINVVRLELEGQRYDSLHLALFLDEDQRMSIEGQSEDGHNWEFFYPDSLYEQIKYFDFFIQGTPDSVKHHLLFRLVKQDDTLRAISCFFGRSSSHIKARYIETTTRRDVLMLRRGTDEVILGTTIRDLFEISTDDQELISSMKIMTYGYGYYSEEFTHEEMMQRDMDFIRQYPNSRAMISLLAYSRYRRGSKDDFAKLFNLFSEELQQSFYGQKIYRHITRVDTVFKNQMFSAWDTDLPELIVQDSSKFNLILFSASWCGPCMRQIPIVKKIYQNLGDKLIMT